MSNKNFSFLVIIVGSLTVFFNACKPGIEQTNIQVDTVIPANSLDKREEVLVSNCNTNVELAETLGSIKTIEKEVLVDNIATNRNGLDYEIPEPLKLRLEIEVEDNYQPIYETARLRLENRSMAVAPNKQTNYVIQWENLVYQSKASFNVQDNVYRVTYQYELIVPKVIYEEELDCPSQTIQLTLSITSTVFTTTPNPTSTIVKTPIATTLPIYPTRTRRPAQRTPEPTNATSPTDQPTDQPTMPIPYP